jgi:hypothetical protein
MLKKVMAFVDGENLVCRYQDMVKNEDAGPRPAEEIQPQPVVWIDQ